MKAMTKVSPIWTIRVGGYKIQEKLEDTYMKKGDRCRQKRGNWKQSCRQGITLLGFNIGNMRIEIQPDSLKR